MQVQPKCFNRQDFKDTVTVQDGWWHHPTAFTVHQSRVPKMITLPDNMSKGCQQWGPLGEATLHGWNCDGCRHKPEKEDD